MGAGAAVIRLLGFHFLTVREGRIDSNIRTYVLKYKQDRTLRPVIVRQQKAALMATVTLTPTDTAPDVRHARHEWVFRRVAPLWKGLLAERGLSDATIAHFEFSPRGQGWQYPIQPDTEVVRWKAFDSTASPKYLWLPNKPGGIRFYDHDGGLKRRIAAADGVLWLASGEADVWALWEGGLHNATCMFDGEARHIPDWFRAELNYLHVAELHIAPDCDEAGARFAVNIRRALGDFAVRLVVHALPFAPDSKGDIGKLLLAVGPDCLRHDLEHLSERIFEDYLSDESDEWLYIQQPLRLFRDTYSLYERWCVDVVEAAALRFWSVSPPDHKGFSKDFRCPFHDDRHPSAGWNYNTHGIHCFACGPHRTKEVADLLGVPSWDDFKADHPGE